VVRDDRLITARGDGITVVSPPCGP
jgi:hypothetical protein